MRHDGLPIKLSDCLQMSSHMRSRIWFQSGLMQKYTKDMDSERLAEESAGTVR